VATGFSMKGEAYFDDVRLDAGPLTGPWQEFADFCGPGFGGGMFALDGDRVAYPNRCSQQQEAHIVVRDADGRALYDVPTGRDNVIRTALAGRYLAYLHYTYPDNGPYGEIVVHDLEADADLYRVPGTNGAFSLQSDGTLARLSTLGPNGEVISSDDCWTIDWISPADPASPHRLPGCAATPPVIAGGRIAYVARDGRTEFAALADLNGNVRRVAAPVEAVDFDGRRLVSRDVRCDGERDLWEEDLSAPPVDSRADCPVRISGSSLRDGHIAPRITCPLGCRGQMSIELPKRRSGDQLSGARSFVLGPRGSSRIRPLFPRVRVLGRRLRRGRVTVRVDVADRSGNRVTTRRRVTVVRR
jgi:hypothetical protein